MRPEDFSASASGQLIRAPDGFWCFAPAPLPPSLTPSWSLTTRLSDADRAVAELAGVGGMLPNPHLLIGPFLRREAVLSSRIEGTTVTAQQRALFEVAGVEQTHDEAEVGNADRGRLSSTETEMGRGRADWWAAIPVRAASGSGRSGSP